MNPQVHSTTDYGKFKSLTFNRDKNKRHIEELKKIISKDNLLHLHPIIVNEKWEVIDGQHRLEAARDLNVPIYYFQENINYEHILNSNSLQRNLTLKDTIKYYSLKEQLQDYIIFRDYMTSLELNPKALFGLLFGTCSAHLMKFMKSGKFRMPPNGEISVQIIVSFSDFMKFVRDKRIKPLHMFTSHNFTIGYRNLVTNKQFNERIFYSKLENRWFEIKPQIDSLSWTKCLVNIYNWKNHNQIEINENGET